MSCPRTLENDTKQGSNSQCDNFVIVSQRGFTCNFTSFYHFMEMVFCDTVICLALILTEACYTYSFHIMLCEIMFHSIF